MIAQPTRGIARLLVFGMAAVAIGGCGSQPLPETAPDKQAASRSLPTAEQKASAQGEYAAAVALQQVGVPYRYGGSTTSGFDCSGLVQYAWAAAGKSLPRTTGQQWGFAETVSADELQDGDLVFFRIEGKMSHVGLYVGDGRFVHAPSSGRTVTVARLDSPFYRRAFLRAARP